jgi:hypothetical protein
VIEASVKRAQRYRIVKQLVLILVLVVHPSHAHAMEGHDPKPNPQGGNDPKAPQIDLSGVANVVLFVPKLIVDVIKPQPFCIVCPKGGPLKEGQDIDVLDFPAAILMGALICGTTSGDLNVSITPGKCSR